jgi:hypothetical protein
MKAHDIGDIYDLIDSKLEWCYGFVLWDKKQERFLICEESDNDPYDEDDFDDNGDPIAEKYAFNTWTAALGDISGEDSTTTFDLEGGHDNGGFACPRSDMPMEEFISLLCYECGEDPYKDLTKYDCYDRFVLIKFYASSVYVDAMSQP